MPELSRELKRDGATSVEVEEGLYDRGGTMSSPGMKDRSKATAEKRNLFFHFNFLMPFPGVQPRPNKGLQKRGET